MLKIIAQKKCSLIFIRMNSREQLQSQFAPVKTRNDSFVRVIMQKQFSSPAALDFHWIDIGRVLYIPCSDTFE